MTLHTADIAVVAMRLSRAMASRAPELDIRPAPGILAKGYIAAHPCPPRGEEN
jgi:hypothetical protein